MKIGELSHVDLEVIFRLTAKSECLHIEKVEYSVGRFFIHCAVFVQNDKIETEIGEKVCFEISVMRDGTVEDLKNAMILGTFDALTKRK